MPETRQLIPLAEAKAPFFVGIDLGGTNTKMGVVDDLGRPLSWLSIPTEVPRGPEDACRRIGAAVRQAIVAAGLEAEAVARVGFASAGPLDIPAGIISTEINLKGWQNYPIRDRVAFHSGLPVTFENDANAAAYGEFWVGTGRDYASMVLFTLGTGIGCGIIIGDLVMRGAHSYGGESGHIILNPDENARLCGCGGRGHLEAYASATGIIARAQEALSAGQATSLSKRIAEGAELTPKLIAIEAGRGDEFSMEVVMEAAHYIALGAVDLIHMLQPALVLLGGAMTFGGQEADLGRRFLGRVRDEVRPLALPHLADTSIEFASMGGDAGFIGAAGVARLDYLDEMRR